MSLATTLACTFPIPKADHVMTMQGILYLKYSISARAFERINYIFRQMTIPLRASRDRPFEIISLRRVVE